MRVLSTLVFVACCATIALADFTYPKVARSDKIQVTDHGTNYSDPYDWLENPDSAETKQFVIDQNKVTQDFISNHPDIAAVNQSFSDLYNYPRYSIPVKHGDFYYITKNDGLQNQGVIYRIKDLASLDDAWEVFLDPNKFSTDGTVSLVFTTFSPNGEYLAFGTSSGGSDWITIGVYDVRTNPPTKLNDSLTKIKFAHVGWNRNNKGFFYAYFDKYEGSDEGTSTEIPKFQKLYYHNLNTAQAQDILVFSSFADKPQLLIGTPVVSQDGKHIHLFPTEGTSNTPWLYLPFDPENITAELNHEWVVQDANAEYYFMHQDDKCVYVRTNYQAANFRLVCVDLANRDPKNWKDVISEHSEWVLSDTIIVNWDKTAQTGKLVAVYMVDVVNMIQIYDLLDNQTAKYQFDVDTPIGTIQSIKGKTEGSEFFYKITTFLSPGIIYRYDFGVTPNRVKVYRESSIPGLNTADYETKQIKYKSKDGTLVPMFIIHRKGLSMTGKNPAMLYAYGGFNINIQPNYDALGMFFVKHLNGVYAVANIRGGGEYGNKWHHAGMRHNKQNVFDDFAYAGKYLTSAGYTSRDYLTINGRSNGGLLVGACSNQFGEIFGAGLANVGVMDMFRFPLFTIGYAWKEEYGDPWGNKADFDYIKTYSPLHTIPNKATYPYPNLLVLTADHDDRVVPAHSYKFIAELQHTLGALRKDTPLMIRIDHQSGHGAGKPTPKWIEEYTDIAVFLLKSMNGRYVFMP